MNDNNLEVVRLSDLHVSFKTLSVSMGCSETELLLKARSHPDLQIVKFSGQYYLPKAQSSILSQHVFKVDEVARARKRQRDKTRRDEQKLLAQIGKWLKDNNEGVYMLAIQAVQRNVNGDVALDLDKPGGGN